MNRPTIYTVGDSHGWHAWLKIPNVLTNYSQSPMTMHSFAITANQIKEKFLIDIPLDGIICFCFGEIDCRCYVHRFQPWQETIDKLVENYFKAIQNCTIGRNPKSLWVYFVPPPVRDAIDSPNYPFNGTIEERVDYVRYMNKKLQELPYDFIDLYDKCSNEDGSMIREYSDYHVHLTNPEPLIEWLDNYFNNRSKNE